MPNNLLKNRIALITGASSGIGAETALLLAQKAIHVVLVARRYERLQELAQVIENNSGKATVIQADLSVESERIRLFNYLNEQNLLPDILVNNAGLAWYGYFHQMPWDIANNIIQLNIAATTHLTLLFLPSMLAKRYGRIINIGSIAGKLPEQGITLYGSSKSYLDSFTTSIFRELRGTGVTASVVRAGPIKTEFFDSARKLENGGSIPAERLAVSSDRVARKIFNLILHPRRFAYVPFYMILSPLLETLFSWIIDLVGPLLLRRHK